jgi:PA domain
MCAKHTSTFSHFARALTRTLALTAALVTISQAAFAEAKITFTFVNNPGEGFFDTTPATPVGGNAGATVGEQRRNVFEAAGSLWGKRLSSDVEVKVLATFQALPCTDTGAVLGAAGPIQIFNDFPGARLASTWYQVALANKLAKQDLAPGDTEVSQFDILARFNANLGQAGCFTGAPFYLGLDGKPGNLIDLSVVTTHELGHGLGFSTISDGDTDVDLLDGKFSVWHHFMYDFSLRKRWVDTTPEERAFSQINPRKIAWLGPNVLRDAPRVLAQTGGTEVFASAPGFFDYLNINASTFGPKLGPRPILGRIADGASDACIAFPAGASLQRKVVLVDRGTCNFSDKVKNAQAAGAAAVLIVNNVPGSTAFAPSSDDTTITIPSGLITQEDGTRLRQALSTAPDRGFASLRFNDKLYAGANFFNAPLMYSPNPYQPGSSLSHFDVSAQTQPGGNLLMEPSYTRTTKRAIEPPDDLTYSLFRDMGW